MQENRKSFIMYTSYGKELEDLSDEEFGLLVRCMIRYINTGEEPSGLEKNLNIVWKMIKGNLIRDKQKYDKRCETSKENGKKGGRPKKPNKPKKADNDNDNDNDIDIDTDNDKNNNIYSATESHNTDNDVDDKLTIDEYNFELIWAEYPRKKGKTNAFKYYRKYVNQGKKINGKNVKLTNEQIYDAVIKYANSVKDKEEQYIQMGSTFFNTTIIDYVDEE